MTNRSFVWFFAVSCVSLVAGAGTALTPRDYVQDGLVALFDGEYNAIVDSTWTHSSDATTWTDLVSGQAVTRFGTVAAAVNGKCYTFNDLNSKGALCYFTETIDGFTAAAATDGFTIEMVARYRTLKDLGGRVAMGGIGTYFQGDKLTYTTKTGQCGNWLTHAAGRRVTSSIVHMPDYAVGSVIAYRDGHAYSENSAISWSYGYELSNELKIGSFSTSHAADADIYCVRVYSRRLTPEEVAANVAVDRARFNDGGDKGTGWTAMNGVAYAYTFPLYTATVADGASNGVSEVTFKMKTAADAAEEDVTYAEFVGSERTGTILKRGGGTLVFDRDIKSFDGPVFVGEGVAIGTCSNCFGKVSASSDRAQQRVYVFKGATLVMDDAKCKMCYAERVSVRYEGEGCPGWGGAWVWRNGNSTSGSTLWPMGVASRPIGDATIYVDVPSGGNIRATYGRGQAGTDFNHGGYAILLHGREVGSLLDFDACYINDYGHLVISNMTCDLNGNSGRILPKYGKTSTFVLTGGARYRYAQHDNLSGSQKNQTGTLYVDDLEFWRVATAGVDPWANSCRNWYCGPVVLNDDIRLYNNGYSSKTQVGISFTASVSGAKGFRPYFNNGNRGYGMRLNLIAPTNTFEGGVVLANGSLGVWDSHAVPSQEGAGLVSITNGVVYFGKKDGATKWTTYAMPVTEFVNAGAVSNGVGRWKGLVKKGSGTLDYNSQLDGDSLDLQEGAVKFNAAYRANYEGDNAAAAPDGYVAAVPAFTTLKGAAGVLDVANLAETYTVGSLVDTPSVQNANVTVTNGWTISAAALKAGNVATFSGNLAFAPGAGVMVTDVASLPTKAGGYVFAQANAISGFTPVVMDGWCVELGADQKSLKLAKLGLKIFIR